MEKLYINKTSANNKRSIKFMAFVVLFLGGLINSYSQVRVPFAPRTASATPATTIYTIKGDFTMMGNTNLTLQNYSATANNNAAMVYVDIDGDPNTWNSSSATLSFSEENNAIPDCSNIIYAGLYWTGRAGTDEIFTVTNGTDTKEFDKRKVQLKKGITGVYQDVVATTTTDLNKNIYFPSGLDDNIYSAYAEITDYVVANGLGEYFVADIATLEGDGGNSGYYGGWGMVVVYENSKMNWRDVTVFDGHAFVRREGAAGTSTNYTFDIDGFKTSENGYINIKLGVMAGEGDVGVSGDTFGILNRTNSLYESLSHSANTPTNFFNSSINTEGNIRNPDLVNNTGVDIAMFKIDNGSNLEGDLDYNRYITNEQTSTSFQYGTSQDTYVIFNVTFSVDSYVPETEIIVENTSTNTSLVPGQSAGFKIDIKNTGTEATKNTTLTIPIPLSVDPANLTFTESVNPIYSPLVNSSPPTILPATAGNNGTIVWNMGTLPLPNNPDDVIAEINFNYNVTTDCATLNDSDFYPYVTLLGMISGTGETSGEDFDFNLIQGYETNGICEGEPIIAPLEIPINFNNYVNEPPTASNPTSINVECMDDVPAFDITVVTDEADNQGTPIVAFVSDVSDGNTCPETITRTYSVTDDCNNSINVTQIITISPIAITYTAPSDNISDACDYVAQSNLDTAFNNWVDAQTAAFSIANGCSPVLTNDSATASISVLCDGGATTITWTITDLCQTITETADFTVTAPVAITYTAPASDNSNTCDYTDQNALDTAFNNWVDTQTAAFSIANGCSPVLTNDSATASIPVLCDGGATTITWTITDLCQTITETADFTVTAPVAITYTAPASDNSNTCDYTDQNALDTAFNNWVDTQTAAFSIANGCSPVLTNDSATASIPVLCDGGATTITWTITDLCQTITETADFTVTAPVAITYTAPASDNSNTCDYTDQNALDTAFNNWVDAQTAAFSIANGCSPLLTNDSATASIPVLCDGGATTITWTITDLCQTITETADFTVTAPVAITYTAPASDASNASEFYDPDATIAQANLDADIAAWLATQNATVNGSVTDGCNPVITNDYINQSISFCASDSITVTWTITDLCETINFSATYTFTQPDGISFTEPSSRNTNACDFDNDDITVAQSDLDADIATWVNNQTNIIINTLTGGSPTVTNDFTNQSLDLCTGGSITINWTIDDICETINKSATFTVVEPVAITYNAPADDSSNTCDYTDQNTLDTAFNNWVDEQTAAFSITNGCSPVLTNNSAAAAIPVLCDGGATTITWTITDLCETFTETADFTVTAPVAITYTAPASDNSNTCDYTDQNALDTAFNNWVDAQTAAFSIANGCSPVLTNDSATASIPVLCDGGATTITWTITDLCQTITETADFTVTAPVAITYTAPASDNSNTCDYTDQNALDTAFNNWVDTQTAAFSIANGCSPVLTNDSATASIPVLCDGGATTITWTITDLCQTITETADFTVTSPVAIIYTAPASDNSNTCDYTDQNALDTAFNNWVDAQTAAFSIANGCSPLLTNDSATASIPVLCDGGATTITWTITDLCQTITETADFTVTAPVAITYTAPASDNSNTCDYTDQNALDTAFNNWLDTQTAAFSIANGCSPVLTNDGATASIPVLCDGGAITITWTITDLCQTITETADFTVTAPVAITYTAPASDASNASEFYDPDATIAQANLDADIAAWLATQNATVNGSVTDGCNPVITNDYINQSISFCASDSITVTWTITDLCETINFSATYTFTQPDGISFTEPSSRNTNACDFDNDDITVAQSDLDADIATWVNNQTNIIINTLTGGSPTVTNDFTNQSLDLCTGGSITINWTIDDICETINKSALYTVTAPTAITYTNPADDTSDACDYTTQSEVDTAFNNWVAAQTAAFSIANGCSPVLTNNSAAAAIPVLCDGGATTITWTITDLCQTITETADFNLTAPIDITYTNPADDTSDACDFGTSDLTAAQSNLDFAIATWVTNETTRVNDSFSGGCSSTVTNDFVAQSIDFCIGGSIEITWSISDLCSTTNVSAMYTFTQPDAPTFNQSTLPSDITVECDVIPDAEALTVSNSCGNLDVIFNETITNGSCPNVYSILRTWTATNICGVSITNTQTVTVEDNTAPELTLPANITAECSDDLTPIAFGTATATDNCDANPIVTFNDVIVDGTCSGNFTITRTWTATDACGNTVSANQIISTADTTAPDFDQTTLPADLVVECDGIPAQEILTATDNCGIATVTVNDVRTDGNCPNNYIITRSYTATDECGVTNTHVQIITVQDSTPPVFVETLPNTNIVVECDAIPVAETLTATDSCDSATVSVSDSRTDGNCPNSYTIVRTWVATDVCGLTTTHTQNIIIQDTTPPTFVESLPRDTTVECNAIPDVTSLTATDNCGDALVTVSDVRTNGNCPSNYSIARTWVATDDCGLTTTHTQVINVQDTTAPVPTSTFETTLDVSCTDIPDAPEVEFTDNCSSNVIVVFDETNSFDENVITDYQIIRTWTVRDACNNEEVYTQTLNVSLDEVLNEVVAEDRCFDEGVLNLDNFLADDVFGGTWEIIEGSTIATINGSIFDPTNLDSAYSEEFNPNTDGIQYVLRYTGFQSGCINITDVIMVVDAKCRVLPCGEKDISISTAITPNGDGFNESFDIQGIDLCGFVAEIKIFNRWGALVFESNDYTLGSLKSGSGVFGDWNGSSPRSSIGNNGQLPNGTYYYIINLRNSGLNPLTGPVYLGTK